MPDKDQADAAAREAQRQVLNLLGQPGARTLAGGPGPAKLRARLMEALTTTRLDACEHITQAWAAGSAIPVHWAAWRPDRAACARCVPLWLVPDTTGHPTSEYCDLCGADRPTDHIQITAGMAVARGDLCDRCQEKPGA